MGVRKYRDLSPEERSEICNGCGGKGGIVTPPHAELFREACDHHDFNYHLGHRERHRWKADRQLRGAMRTKVRTTPAAILRGHLPALLRRMPAFAVRQIFYRWCDAYYLAVALVGWRFFHYAEKEQTI